MYLKDKNKRITIRISHADYMTICYLANCMKKSKTDFLRFIIKSYIIQLERLFNENN